MWEVSGRIQVSKSELHTHIHLDYSRVKFLFFIKKKKYKFSKLSINKFIKNGLGNKAGT